MDWIDIVQSAIEEIEINIHEEIDADVLSEQQFVFKSQGWNEISEVKVEPWGGRSFSVTTIDNVHILAE
ncbi:hypothetical protein [Anaerosporobacter sp.]